ncbi:hypothetical protein BDW71DRAFT_81740 [Aspergillus fruticulosus]
MAYQFFAKAHQAKRSSASPPLPKHSSPPSRNAHGNPPKYPPSAVAPPPSAPLAVNITAKLPPTAKDTSFQPSAYPDPIRPGYPTPHEHVTIEPVSTAHIPSLSRITSLLLPIRYPNYFYTATVTDPVIASVSRVAIYHDHPVAFAPALGIAESPTTGTDKVIGGIRCRLERLSKAISEEDGQEPANLYIQTLHLLSPYRGRGIAASLLNSLLFASTPTTKVSSLSDYELSDLVKHYNIRSVTAHVHEANEDGLKWYISRGFQVEEEIVENYYRRLKPSGARIVKLQLHWDRTGTDSVAQRPPAEENNERQNTTDADADADADDGWEKIEAEDELELEELGVHSFTGSTLLDGSARKKRKTNGEE